MNPRGGAGRPKWYRLAWPLLVCAVNAEAALPQAEAAAWLQKMADASRHLAYEGVYVVRQGDNMRTLSVSNHPSGQGSESSIVSLDGNPREVRCNGNGAVTLVPDGSQIHMEKRLNNRHFPDLLPANPLALVNWYEVRLGEMARVAGLDCRNVEIQPRDAFRWGYALCAEKSSGLPLKAVLINGNQALLQYTFAEIKLGADALKPWSRPLLPATMPEPEKSSEEVAVKSLPPGYTRIAAVRRHLPNMPGEVEHWVFSDGLMHISLFLAPNDKPAEPLKGVSPSGLVNLMRRQVGEYQATVLGDAPWAAVEAIAQGLVPKK